MQLSDGRIASAGGENAVQIWDPADPDTTLAIYTGHSDLVVTMVELADGRIASPGDDTVQIWYPADR